jgi:hypothetical protein
MSRVERLSAFRRVLNTPDGKLLMAELEELCDPEILFESDPYVMAAAVGARDIYKLLKIYQSGDISDD